MLGESIDSVSFSYILQKNEKWEFDLFSLIMRTA